jgi:hypothetical protein
MPRLSPVILSVAAISSLIAASYLSSRSGLIPPAFAQGCSSSSSSCYTPPSSSTPPPDTSSIPVPPPGNSGGTAGGYTDFNLAKDAREQPTALIGCTGTATEPDLWFRNIGNTTLTAGTVVTWMVPSTGERGTFALPKDIKPGDYLPDNSALAAALGKNGSCIAALLS